MDIKDLAISWIHLRKKKKQSIGVCPKTIAYAKEHFVHPCIPNVVPATG